MPDNRHDPMNGRGGASRAKGGVMARELDPDISPWERQPQEPEDAYALFIKYRDSEKRIVVKTDEDESPSRLRRLSATWSWGYRSWEWDKHQGRVEAKELVRYRISMNQRHRNAARAAQSKITQWLLALDPSRLTPTEAARWYDLAVRIEREAAGALVSQGPDAGVVEEPQEDQTSESLSELVGISPDMEQRAAQILYQMAQIDPSKPVPADG